MISLQQCIVSVQMSDILLISPPFTQLNTPYPATAYLKGFLQTREIDSAQLDLGIETILALFSKEGIRNLFEAASPTMAMASDNSKRIFALRELYLKTIEPAIHFLQDQDPTLAHLICERNYLPEASRFDALEDPEWAFGTMGIRDQARHLASLYLEDLSDFIVEMVDPFFGFSRYAETLSLSASSFDELYDALQASPSYLVQIMTSLLAERLSHHRPSLVCFSVPFPGNLFSTLACGKWIKDHCPEITIAIGGGYPNTELRSLTDPRIFQFLDIITLDDGERPLLSVLDYLEGKTGVESLKRTFLLQEGRVAYYNDSKESDIRQEELGTPDYDGLPLKKYLSVIQLTNPMHRLWSDGRWNKLTMAHGCYWGKCTFCDISLPYIHLYEGSSAKIIADRMEELVCKTGETGFHFVDEAAPPSLMKAVALEILRRNLVVSWWTNIRFEKAFTPDLCRLLAASGCIAVSGGLEVASDRLLALIAKGVTIRQVSQVTESFTQAGIMVHAYLMYGFPTQTDQETIDSLEVVRQMFQQGILQSAFWHRFAMTAHSPVGLDPASFGVTNLSPQLGTFANNDLIHEDPAGAEHEQYSEGLNKSLYNFMHGVGLDFPLQDWFEQKIPQTSHAPDLVAAHLESREEKMPAANQLVVWLEGPVSYESASSELLFHLQKETVAVECEAPIGVWLEWLLAEASPGRIPLLSINQVQASWEAHVDSDFMAFWTNDLLAIVRQLGLVVV